MTTVFDLSRVTLPTYNGSGHSLAIAVHDSVFRVTVPLCTAGGTVDLSMLSFSAQILIRDLAGAATVQVSNLMFFTPENAEGGMGWVSPGRSVGTNQWFTITGTASWPSSTQGGLFLYFSTPSTWSGTVYLDDVVFSP
jgi:hypothetical protein